MAKLPVFSSKNVKIAYGEVSIVGLSPDSSIEIAPSANITDTEVGADGSLQISMLPDQTGTVTLSLQQSSPSNITLAAIVNTMEITGQLVEADLTINDPSGSTFCIVHNAHIQAKPTLSVGSTATGVTRDWVFFAERVTYQPVKPDNTNAAQIVADAVTAGELLKKYLLA